LADGYRQATDSLGTETADEVGALWDRTEGEGRFAPVAALVVGNANRRAVTLADRYLGDVLALARREAVVVFPTDTGLYVDGRLIRRALTGQERGAATVFARSEPLDAGRAVLRRSMPRLGVTRGVRQGGTCPICSPLNGTTVPTTANVRSHKGCACVVVPIT
jgi:hypothetical protein